MFTKYVKVTIAITIIAASVSRSFLSNPATAIQRMENPILTIEVDNWVSDVDWHPDTSLLAAAIGYEVFIFNTNSGALENKFHPEVFVDIKSLHWSPDGSMLAVLGNTIRNQVYANTLSIWDATELAETQRFSGEIVTSFDWNPTEGLFVFTTTGIDSDDLVMQIADDESGEILTTLNVHQLLDYPPASGTSTSAAVWTGSSALASAYYRGYIAHVSSDGVVKQDGFWGLGADEHLWLGGIGVDHSLAWNHTTSQLAITGHRNPRPYTIWIWCLPNANLQRVIEIDSGPITEIQWSPNGMYLASGSVDRSIRIWDVDSFEETDFFEHDDVVTSLAWSGNSQMLATGSRDRTIRIWEIPQTD